MESSKIINIPGYWVQPKYSLGQRIKNGIIVGIQYQLPDNLLAESNEGLWSYIVKVNASSKEKDKEVEELQEHEVKALSTQELRKLLTAEIEVHQRKIAVLTQQMPSIP